MSKTNKTTVTAAELELVVAKGKKAGKKGETIPAAPVAAVVKKTDAPKVKKGQTSKADVEKLIKQLNACEAQKDKKSIRAKLRRIDANWTALIK
jgi:hypothetical protein